MGTSVSIPSPKTTGWKAVSLGYIQDDIPVERVLNEIWRASQSQDFSLTNAIESESIFHCHQIIRESSNAHDALKKATMVLINSKRNSIVGELARRSIPMAFKADNPASAWRSLIFSELTNYLISRDISGYVGSNYRNKTVSDVIKFKALTRKQVNNVINRICIDPSTLSEWKDFVKRAVRDISE